MKEIKKSASSFKKMFVLNLGIKVFTLLTNDEHVSLTGLCVCVRATGREERVITLHPGE